MTEIESFFSRVTYSDNCWEWSGYRQYQGYGIFNWKYKTMPAHRWSFQFFVEPLIDGKLICHHCDNPCCVNPFHLYQGTEKTNAYDVLDRKRHPIANRTHCDYGHEFSKENTYWRKRKGGSDYRACKACTQARNKKWKKKNVEWRREYHRKYWHKRKARTALQQIEELDEKPGR